MQFWITVFVVTSEPPFTSITVPFGSLAVRFSSVTYTLRMMSTWSPGTMSVPTPLIWSTSMSTATMPVAIEPARSWPTVQVPALVKSRLPRSTCPLVMLCPAILPMTWPTFENASLPSAAACETVICLVSTMAAVMVSPRLMSCLAITTGVVDSWLGATLADGVGLALPLPSV